MPNHDLLTRAASLWQSGQALEAGQLIFENVKTEVRPTWATAILQSVVHRTGTSLPSIDAILRIAHEPTEWSKAHEGFSALRRAALKFQELQGRSREQELVLSLLFLAEAVAKVVYNATNPPDPFDEDSGWWIVANLKEVLDLMADDQFSKSMWAALCRESGLIG